MRKLVYRYLWFTIGVIINSFGVAIITKAALGTSPISSVPYVLSLRFAPSLGQFTFVMNLLFIAAQVVLRGRKFPPIQFLQIVVNLVFSAFIDVGMKALWWFEPTSLPVKLVALVIIALILSFVFFHGINGLGVGTIVSALIVGRFVNLYNAHLPLIPRIRMLRAVAVPEAPQEKVEDEVVDEEEKQVEVEAEG